MPAINMLFPISSTRKVHISETRFLFFFLGKLSTLKNHSHYFFLIILEKYMIFFVKRKNTQASANVPPTLFLGGGGEVQFFEIYTINL